MNYGTGEVACLWDIVRIGDDIGQVEDVIIGGQQQQHWAVDEDGLMILHPVYGRAFESPTNSSWNDVRFIARRLSLDARFNSSQTT